MICPKVFWEVMLLRFFHILRGLHRKREKGGKLEMVLPADVRGEGPMTQEAREFRGHSLKAGAAQSTCGLGPTIMILYT